MLTYLPIILYTAIICLASVGIHISMPWRREPFYRQLISILGLMIVHVITTWLIQFVFPEYTYIDIGSLLGWLYLPLAYYMMQTGAGYQLSKKDMLHLLPFVVVLPFFVSSILIRKMEGADTRVYDSLVRGGMGLAYLGYLIWAVIFWARYCRDRVDGILRLVSLAVVVLVLSIFLFWSAVAIWDGPVEPGQATDKANIFVFTCILIATWQLYLHVVRLYGIRVLHRTSSADGEDESVAEEMESNTAHREIRIEYKRYVKQVDKFIASKQYLEPGMNVEKFASLVDIPKTHIPSLFQEHYKTTFSHFVNTLRIQYACGKLKEPSFSLSVDELAEECGFRSRASFYRNFNQEIACTPLEYRKKVITESY